MASIIFIFNYSSVILMRYIKYVVITFLIVVLFNSCAEWKSMMTDAKSQTRWIGRTANDIIMTYGAPDREASDGSDGTIIIYEDFETVRKSSVKSNVRYYIEFFIDSQKVCYHVRTNLSEWSFNHPFSRPWGD